MRRFDTCRESRNLNENNIGTDRIYHDSSRTIGLYAIHLNKGERNFTYWRENSAARLLANDQKILKVKNFKNLFSEIFLINS